MIRFQLLRTLWLALTITSAAVVIFEPDHPPTVFAAIFLLAFLAKYLRSYRRNAAVRSAVCPLDGHLVELQLKHWGPRAVPLVQCPVGRRTFIHLELLAVQPHRD